LKFHTSIIRAKYRNALAKTAAFIIKSAGTHSRPAPITTDSAKRFLIIRLDRVGDMLLSTPVFESIKKNIPGSSVTVLLNRYCRGVLKNNPYVDRIIEYGSKEYVKAVSAGYDAAVVLTYDFDLSSAFACYKSGAAIRVGFKDKYTDAFYNVEIEKDPRAKYEASRNIELLEKAGFKSSYSKPALFISAEEDAEGAQFFARNGIGTHDLVVGLHPGSKRKPRRWPVSSFASAASILRKKYGVKLVISEGPGENRLSRGLNALLGGNVPVLKPSSITGWAAVYKRMNLFICGDTGPIHIAMAVGLPIVGIYGKSDYSRWAPEDNPKLAIISGKGCSDIKVDEVVPAAERLLAEFTRK